ncbi:hypothetical protein BDL97_16G033500 [Sphagnum fallax]|nr:hypothetical protein BDL97_16G033500 [Sphagnum fallax]
MGDCTTAAAASAVSAAAPVQELKQLSLGSPKDRAQGFITTSGCSGDRREGMLHKLSTGNAHDRAQVVAAAAAVASPDNIIASEVMQQPRNNGDLKDRTRRLANGSHILVCNKRPPNSAQSSITNSTQSSHTTTSRSSYNTSTSLRSSNKQARVLLHLCPGLDEITSKPSRVKHRRIMVPSHMDSYQISDLLNPPRGIRDEMQRQGITPRDHRKDNRAKIAELSARNHAEKQAIQNKPDPIDHVLFQDQKIRSPFQCRERKVKACENVQAPSENGESIQSKPKSKDSINYVTKNALDAACVANRRKTKTECPSYRQKENFGKSSPFQCWMSDGSLLKRKLELAMDAERRLQAEQTKHLPPGLVLMKDEERLDVLKTLEDSRLKWEERLRNMPLIMETPSQIRMKAEADYQLRDIEDSIRRFSRSKVYIRYPETGS